MTTKTMTYQELAEHLGIEPASAKRLALRRRWPKTIGNDGRSRVTVPMDELPDRAVGDDAGDDAARRKPQADDAAGDDTDVVATAVTVLSNHINRLEREIEALKQERAEAVARAADRDVIAVQLEGLKDALDIANQRVADQKQHIEAERRRGDEAMRRAERLAEQNDQQLAVRQSWFQKFSKLLARAG